MYLLEPDYFCALLRKPGRWRLYETAAATLLVKLRPLELFIANLSTATLSAAAF